MKNIFLALVISLVSFDASAAWTGHKEISKLKVQDNGIYLVLKEFQNSDPNVDCGSNGFWLGFSEEPYYQAKLSVLLAAHMSGKTVTLSYYECGNGHIALGSVEIK